MSKRRVLQRNEDVTINECRAWLERADASYIAARILFFQDRRFLIGDSNYLMQQAIEKYLKTYIVNAERIESPKFRALIIKEIAKLKLFDSGDQGNYATKVLLRKTHDLNILVKLCAESEKKINEWTTGQDKKRILKKMSGRFATLQANNEVKAFLDFLTEQKDARYGKNVSAHFKTQPLELFDKIVCFIRNKIWFDRETLQVTLTNAIKQDSEPRQTIYKNFKRENKYAESFNFTNLTYSNNRATPRIIFKRTNQ